MKDKTINGKTFSEIHREYAPRYRLEWLHVNEALIATAQEVGIDPSEDDDMALLLTGIAAYILDREAAARPDTTSL